MVRGLTWTLREIAIGIDQLLNTIARGWADETLSARAWRMHEQTAAWALTRRIIDGIFFWQPHHCKSAYESEQDRKQLPPEYRSRP